MRRIEPPRTRPPVSLLTIALATALASLLAALGCGAQYTERAERAPAYERARPVAAGRGAEAPPPAAPAPVAASSTLDWESEAVTGDLVIESDRRRAPTYRDDGRSSGTATRSEAKPEPDTRGLEQPLVVYLGYLKLRVKRLLDAIDEVTRITEESGGYIESLGAQVVVVRVPATDFDAAMATFARIGDVLDRRVKALDVSAQFTDLRGRLSVALEARERLLKLLDEVEDVQERLRILQEVKRLTERIESIESTLSTLQNLVDYFTITIELEPVLESGAVVVHRSPFPWVRRLKAHVVTVEDGRDDVGLALPDGFVLFEQDDVYQAKAADTTTLRAGFVRNEPRGDAAFWADAVLHELDGRDERLVEDGTAGRLTYRVFRNEDVQPRTWLVAVHAAGDRLFVVEVFYPNEEAFERHHEAVVAALATFRVK